MVNDIKSVADRLKGLRDILDVTEEEAAEACGVSVEQYKKYEAGESNIPLGVMDSMAKRYKFDMSTLISGDEPHNKSYFVTKLGEEVSVNLYADYIYQYHAQGFTGRKVDPFVCTVPQGDNNFIHYNQHPGQEFDFVIEGVLKVVVDTKEFILKAGESVYFDARQKHGFIAMEDTTAKFLAIVI